MNYFAVYERLVERARQRVLAQPFERHHVIPRCLGGPDVEENIVRLTSEEHFVAHQLLVKMHPGNGKLIWAAIAMTDGGRGKHRANNKIYGWLRRQFIANQTGSKYSADRRAKIGAKSKERNRGEKHPMFGRRHSDATRAAISAANKGKPSAAKGRKMSDATKAKLAEAQRRHQEAAPNPFAGREHTEEAKAKMRVAQAAYRQKLENLQA